jgi:hypothetical protein
LLLLLALCPQSWPETIRVPADAPTIQAAIDVAEPFDTILVAPGVYVETIDFLGKRITVRSEAGAAATVIDGNDGSFEPTVSFHSNEELDSVLHGFTVTGGDNRSLDVLGGGISAATGELPNATPTIVECVITGNSTSFTPGGGVAGNPQLEDCTISNNVAGGGYEGGGVFGAPRMFRCVVSDNRAEEGGGLYLTYRGGTDAWIQDCVISGNSAVGSGRGGGVFIEDSYALLLRCLVYGNRAVGSDGSVAVRGAGVFVWGFAFPRLWRCTIVDNRVEEPSLLEDDFGGLYGLAHIMDGIVRGNDETQLGGATHAYYSNVEGGFSGEGNIDVDPLFVDGAEHDYRLAAGSPCIDTGNPTSELDPDGTRADQGSSYYPQANVVLRPGSGVNRLCFTSLSAPFVGETWHGRVDASGHANAKITGFLVVDRPRLAPLSTLHGEILIGLAGTHLLRMAQPTSGGADDFQVAIPPDVTLVGFAAYAQGFVLGGHAELCNALDLKLGN